MKFIQKATLFILRLKLNFLSFFSAAKAAEKAFILFCTPQKRPQPSLPAIFKQATPQEIVFQGFFTFGLVYYSCGNSLTWNIPILPAIASSLLIGGFYPLTQIYQHQSDKKDGVITISYILGYRGNFIFCGIVYSIAMLLLSQYYINQHTLWKFFLFMTMGIPVVFFFLRWAKMVWHNFSAANFDNTMKMNLIASCCTNLAFLILLIAKYFE
jgi:1,4-dihydroxy-2-naphthoate octaprenyltransferase